MEFRHRPRSGARRPGGRVRRDHVRPERGTLAASAGARALFWRPSSRRRRRRRRQTLRGACRREKRKRRRENWEDRPTGFPRVHVGRERRGATGGARPNVRAPDADPRRELPDERLRRSRGRLELARINTFYENDRYSIERVWSRFTSRASARLWASSRERSSKKELSRLLAAAAAREILEPRPPLNRADARTSRLRVRDDARRRETRALRAEEIGRMGRCARHRRVGIQKARAAHERRGVFRRRQQF
mmetsp:Transcript_3056/g.12199  ORF Transcript_3056/g.12199 Transcript_3056/m.12199 type:complete len:248 (-) Transcript_3056:269-1012(-)